MTSKRRRPIDVLQMSKHPKNTPCRCKCRRQIDVSEMYVCSWAFWSGSLHCITKDRHLVYFWRIIIIIFSLSSNTSATGDIFDLSIHYNIVYRHPKFSCDDALFPCHNVFSWKLFIVKFVLNVNSIRNLTIKFEFIWEYSYLGNLFSDWSMLMSSSKIQLVAQKSVVNHL